ncbi:uncharacterized protein [Anoplolepis gracilipes]|uniref:uncharacterized protein n=1 Tax=Anoplolepis gracilipes TaxID=354296 RepID=UPI003B9E63F4
MTHPSRPKQSRHDYTMHKLRVVDGTKWDYSFPRRRAYWEKFCDNEEKRLIRVRDSFPKLSYLPIIPTLHDSETDFCDIVDFNAPSTSQGFDENVLLIDPKSFKTSDISSKRDDDNTYPNIEPIVKVSPPTPLKKISKNDAVTITKTNAEKEHIIVKNKCMIKVNSCKEAFLEEFLNVPSKTSIIPYDESDGDGKVYSKKTCPFHKHGPAIKIFDDDIEKYLRDDPRDVSSNQKLIKLPLLKNTSNKYDKIKRKITSAKNKKIKDITSSRKKLESYPDDDFADLTANEIAKIEFKENNILDKQCNLRSDFLKSDLKFSPDKKSRKEKKTAKDTKIASLCPKSFQPQSEIKTSSDKLIIKCPKLQKYLNIPKTQEKFIDESK